MDKVQIDQTWKKHLANILEAPVLKDLFRFLEEEKKKEKIIFPPKPEIFAAFSYTHFDHVKVVIIGQDPYHGSGEAQGLCFSVRNGTKLPPSLKNIYKEISRDLNLIMPKNNGSLIPWAEQGVLLINSVLTVEKDKPASHRGKGWELFTDEVINILNNEKNHLVFLLWGKDAKAKGEKIDRHKHLVLESGHPSPFSARLFHGQYHFSKCNEYLIKAGIKPIDWHLNEVP